MSQRKYERFSKKKETPPKHQVIMMKNHDAIRLSISESPNVVTSSSYIPKHGILHFLPKEKSWTRVYYFFPRGDCFEPVTLQDRKRANLIKNRVIFGQ